MERAHAENKVAESNDVGQISFAGANREAALDMLEKTNIDELTDSECRELLKDMAEALK